MELAVHRSPEAWVSSLTSLTPSSWPPPRPPLGSVSLGPGQPGTTPPPSACLLAQGACPVSINPWCPWPGLTDSQRRRRRAGSNSSTLTDFSQGPDSGSQTCGAPSRPTALLSFYQEEPKLGPRPSNSPGQHQAGTCASACASSRSPACSVSLLCRLWHSHSSSLPLLLKAVQPPKPRQHSWS